jgi:acyl-CoA thioester hydrolase
MSEPLLTYRGTVHMWHCDHMGHMNVMWYVGKFDEATWHLLAAIGLTSSVMHENKTGMAGVEQQITYKKELFPGDVVSIHSRVLEVKEKSIRVEHVMSNDVSRDVAATMVLTAVHLDRSKRKACAFPAEIRAKAEALVGQ